MWTVWNLSFEPELERRRKNMTIELRYMLAQLILADFILKRRDPDYRPALES